MHSKGLKGLTEIEGRISERNFPSLEFLGPTIWQLRDKPYGQSIFQLMSQNLTPTPQACAVSLSSR